MYTTGRVLQIKISDNSVTEYVTGLPVYNPFGLGFSANGDLLIAYYSNAALVKYSNGVVSSLLTNLPASATDVKIDAAGYIYVSFWGSQIRKYNPDMTAFVEVSGSTIYCWGMTLTASGTLIYGDYMANKVFTLQTGATLSGTPSHNDVGQHPVKIMVSNGTVSAEQEFIITVTDPNPPLITDLTPAHKAMDVSLDSNLSVIFSEEVVKGSGNIYLIASATGDTLQTIDIQSSQATIDGSKLFVDIAQLPSLTDIHILMDAGLLKDVNGNNFAGISNVLSWTFTSVEQPKDAQSITFAAYDTLTYGAQDYTPAATSTSGLAVNYESSDLSVATIVNGQVHILKTGFVTITAKQEGDDDYLPATPVTQELVVIKKDITVTLSTIPAISKIYDGDSTIVLSASNYLLNGVINSDDVTVNGISTFDGVASGKNKTVTASSFILTGAQSYNYTLVTTEASVDGAIEPKEVSLIMNSSPAISKVYDGTTAAITRTANYSLSGLIGNDQVSVTGNAVYSDKNASASKAITVSEFILSGKDKDNYTLITTTAAVTGAITPAALVITAENKTRKQGESNPAFSFTYIGLAQGDTPADLTTAATAQTTATAVSPIGYFDIITGGASSDNYTISFINGKLTIAPNDGEHLKVWTSSPSVLQIRVYSEINQASRIAIFTAAGQPVNNAYLALRPGVNSTTMSVGNLASGVYIVHIQTGNFKESQRVRIK
ncbi:MAG: Ig-like domain-containing protein [Gemmatimonadaceae bacterium]|nr:Ig-like domain-containing protein [Chitinophagaceae bacterium]